MKVYSVAIIGAGQLGSRHLQGLSVSKYKFHVHVVDPSKASLNSARDRLEEVSNEFYETVKYYSEIGDLPKKIDLVILSTTASIRRHILELLLAHAKVRFLILEKVVFQCSGDFQHIQGLLRSQDANAWINCPRRIFPFYMQLKRQLKGERIRLTVFGNNWGLACNSIHFIDLLYFLSDEKQDIKFEIKNLNKTIVTSKRSKFYELHGSFEGRTASGNNI